MHAWFTFCYGFVNRSRSLPAAATSISCTIGANKAAWRGIPAPERVEAALRVNEAAAARLAAGLKPLYSPNDLSRQVIP
jgi:hypothetical protein